MFERDFVIFWPLGAGGGGGQTGAARLSLPVTVSLGAGCMAVSAGNVPRGAGLALVWAGGTAVSAGAGQLPAVAAGGGTVPA